MFTVNVEPSLTTRYKWTVSAGTIISGQGTTSITVDTAGLGGQNVTAAVEIAGLDPICPRTASSMTAVKPPPPIDGHSDQYGNIRFNDEKARLDNFTIQLQNEPSATGYIIAYGSCATEGLARANRAKGYVVNTRRLDPARVVTIDAGCLPELQVQLYIVPQGATPPTGHAVGVASACPVCKKEPPGSRSTRRRVKKKN